jgi:uncharacterized membrane protein
MNVILQIILLSIIPISELRGGIPLAIASGFNPISAFLICTLANIVIIPIVFLFLNTINVLLLKIPPYSTFFHKTIERSRKKIHNSIEKYGYLGLAIFVAIPLPFTGAYTGVLGAWALGMDKRKAFASIALGVIVAGIIVTLVSYYGLSVLSIFLK